MPVLNTPNEVAAHVAAHGHQSMAALERAGFWQSTVHRTIEMRLIREVPRLGGYVAAADVTRSLLGDIAAGI